MKKVAIVVQRYGLEVNGGSEYYSMQIAEHLKERFEIEIITTTAVDHITWKNYYPAGISDINNIKVRRFHVDQERDQKCMNRLNSDIFSTVNASSTEKEMEWILAQGPVSTGLIEYIQEHGDEYDAFIVMTYLYYPAIKSLPLIGNKAIFIPTAHEEPYIHFNIFKEIFTLPKAFIFLTDEEKNLVQNLFNVKNVLCDVCGVGIELPENIHIEAFKEKHNLSSYIIYVGRIETGKCCDELFEFFLEYKRQNNNNLKLVLMGKAAMEIPKHKDILSLGFVTEEEKFSGIAGAKALIMSSKFESLSIVVLEAMALSVPVIVNGKCDVLRGHCLKSNAGLYYENFPEFEGVLNYLLIHPEIYEKMCKNAKTYVDKNYQWNIIVNKFEKLIENIS